MSAPLSNQRRYVAHRPRRAAPICPTVIPAAARPRPRKVLGNPSLAVEYGFVGLCLTVAAALWRIGQGG